jgi:hypothetical protein
MKRNASLVFLGALVLSSALARDPVPIAVVDLNDPSAVERLRASNPKHFAVIEQIVNGLGERSSGEVPTWIRTTFGARDVSYPPVILVTDPPQARLSFSLDGVRYRAKVTLERGRARIYPAKHR